MDRGLQRQRGTWATEKPDPAALVIDADGRALEVIDWSASVGGVGVRTRGGIPLMAAAPVPKGTALAGNGSCAQVLDVVAAPVSQPWLVSCLSVEIGCFLSLRRRGEEKVTCLWVW